MLLGVGNLGSCLASNSRFNVSVGAASVDSQGRASERGFVPSDSMVKGGRRLGIETAVQKKRE